MAGWDIVPSVGDDGERYLKAVQRVKPYKGGVSKAKVIKCGHIVQVYEYENPIYLPSLDSRKGQGGRKKAGESEHMERTKEYREYGVRKAKNKVRSMAIANFGEHDFFVTLTFSDSQFVQTRGGVVEFERFMPIDIKNVNDTNKEFKKFIQRMRESYGKDFRYLAVIEYQDKKGRGAVHYHLITDAKGLNKENVKKLWGLGFIDVKDIREVDNVGAYISYYMTKGGGDSRLEGKKAYLSSRNLKKPEVLYMDEAYGEVMRLESLGKVPTFTNKYESEFCGEVKFKEYNLMRQGGEYN